MLEQLIDTHPNFHVTTRQHVTRVLVKTPLSARQRELRFWISGVEVCKSFMGSEITNMDSSWPADAWCITMYVSCSKEFILAAENIHTAQILKLSGIVQTDILNNFNIPLIITCPGLRKTSKMVSLSNSVTTIFVLLKSLLGSSLRRCCILL